MIDANSDLTAVQAALVSQQIDLDAKRAAVAAEAMRRLTEHHQEICLQCRQAEDELKRVEGEMVEGRRENVRSSGEVENVRRHVADWQEVKPGTNFTNVEGRTEYRVSQYPTAEEFAHWDRELWRRQQAASEAQAADTAAWTEYEKCRFAWHKARDVFNALVDKEQQIRNDLLLDAGKLRLLIEDESRGTTMA
jgi:hypothetical protein